MEPSGKPYRWAKPGQAVGLANNPDAGYMRHPPFGRHKDNPMKCAHFNLGHYFRVRLVDSMLFARTRFIPIVRA